MSCCNVRNRNLWVDSPADLEDIFPFAGHSSQWVGGLRAIQSLSREQVNAYGDRPRPRRHRRTSARAPGGPLPARIPRTPPLPSPSRHLRRACPVRPASAPGHRRLPRGAGGAGQDRGRHPRRVAVRPDHGPGEFRLPRALRGPPLRPRRHGEPDQGAAAGAVRRPDPDGDHAGQPAAGVPSGLRRDAGPDRPGGRPRRDGPCQGAARHHPGAAPEGRLPAAGGRPPDPPVAVPGASIPGTVPPGGGGAAAGRRGAGLALAATPTAGTAGTTRRGGRPRKSRARGSPRRARRCRCSQYVPDSGATVGRNHRRTGPDDRPDRYRMPGLPVW